MAEGNPPRSVRRLPAASTIETRDEVSRAGGPTSATRRLPSGVLMSLLGRCRSSARAVPVADGISARNTAVARGARAGHHAFLPSILLIGECPYLFFVRGAKQGE